MGTEEMSHESTKARNGPGVKERAILFSGAMVRAGLAERVKREE